ncbi:hypothetical protein O5D80_007132 [Batrachochytrium dendrobatidis]|nr:hypothetical protein O5D80_007132 [Batrachochytrium dendrobatidis]
MLKPDQQQTNTSFAATLPVAGEKKLDIPTVLCTRSKPKTLKKIAKRLTKSMTYTPPCLINDVSGTETRSALGIPTCLESSTVDSGQRVPTFDKGDTVYNYSVQDMQSLGSASNHHFVSQSNTHSPVMTLDQSMQNVLSGTQMDTTDENDQVDAYRAHFSSSRGQRSNNPISHSQGPIVRAHSYDDVSKIVSLTSTPSMRFESFLETHFFAILETPLDVHLPIPLSPEWTVPTM